MHQSTPLKLASFLLSFILLYHEVLRHMFNKWLTPEGSHGPLIVLVSLYLIWIKRKDIKATPASPSLLPGATLLATGCFMLFAGKLSSTMLIQQMSMIPVLLGTICLFLGLNHFKIFLLPVGYLIFLMGILETLFGTISIYLQTISAYIAFLVLELIGFSVMWSATIIELPHISMEVAPDCSGISHIVSLLAFAVILAYLSQKTLIRKSLLILAALLIGIFANGLRVALIGIYAKYNHGTDLHGPYETLYVSFIFFFGLLLLVILSHFLRKVSFSKKTIISGAPQKVAWTCSASLPLDVESKQKSNEIKKTFIATITGIAIFVFTLSMIFFYQPVPVYPENSLQIFPSYIGGFTGNDLLWVNERIRPFPADEELLRVYQDNDGNRIKLYIGYFTIQSRDKKIIDYRRAWMHQDTVPVQFMHGRENLVINKTRLQDINNPPDVYFWYFMNGRIITNQFAGKFFTFWDALLKRKNNAAVIIIQTTNPENEAKNFLNDIMPLIQNHLQT